MSIAIHNSLPLNDGVIIPLAVSVLVLVMIILATVHVFLLHHISVPEIYKVPCGEMLDLGLLKVREVGEGVVFSDLVGFLTWISPNNHSSFL